mmetsp:Transcript_18066/g.45689  ORF Transcript_18066/g.45689 Transcript_18066/m.45689 type:complete len:239 (-) Transcript_18066:1920-2636(-)
MGSRRPGFHLRPRVLHGHRHHWLSYRVPQDGGRVRAGYSVRGRRGLCAGVGAGLHVLLVRRERVPANRPRVGEPHDGAARGVAVRVRRALQRVFSGVYAAVCGAVLCARAGAEGRDSGDSVCECAVCVQLQLLLLRYVSGVRHFAVSAVRCGVFVSDCCDMRLFPAEYNLWREHRAGAAALLLRLNLGQLEFIIDTCLHKALLFSQGSPLFANLMASLERRCHYLNHNFRLARSARRI